MPGIMINSGVDREWHDDIRHAIIWTASKEIPLDSIHCPIDMRDDLLKANVLKVKVTKLIEIIQQEN